MLDLLFQGGPLFMGILTILFFIIIFLSIKNGVKLFGNSTPDQANYLSKIKLIKSIGLLALIIGILGQLIGLYSAFSVMEGLEEGISTAILAGGLRVSMITTIYGVIIYVTSLLIWMGLRSKIGTQEAG